MIEKAYAKINLSLDVLSKRDDGYHNLESIMIPIELHDSIEISILSNTNDDFVTCDDFNLSIGKYNLCHILLDSARKKWGFKEHFRVHIHKNIFLRAGLGGGSADAAATLRGIIKLLKLKATEEELIELASSIGSDVPWALFNKPAIVKGKGEILEPFTTNGEKYYVLLVKPEEGLSTQKVFSELDSLGYSSINKTNIVKEAYINGNLEDLQKNMYNLLEKPAIKFVPEIETLKTKLKEEGFEVVMMSGAGSTVFGITRSLLLAKKTLKKYEKLNYNVELTRTL